MSELSYFQRYTQRENHITNNVLLMLRMLYRSHPQKLQVIIESIMTGSGREDTELTVGPVFQQQVSGSNSMPDAVISQQPFMIMVEVKPGEHWDRKQILRHIKSAKSINSENAILLLLSTANEPQFDDILVAKAKKANILLLHLSFETLLDLIDSEDVVAPHETDLQNIVDDFRDILWDEGLLNDPYEMFAFGCSRTIDWNIQNKMYYDRITRPSKANVLTGFYANREIHAIGRVSAILVGNTASGYSVEKEHATKTKTELTKQVESASKKIVDMTPDEPLRWYIYDDLFKTSFRKSTPYGYFQGVWMHLETFLHENTVPDDLKSIAKQLNGATFDNDRGYVD